MAKTRNDVVPRETVPAPKSAAEPDPDVERRAIEAAERKKAAAKAARTPPETPKSDDAKE